MITKDDFNTLKFWAMGTKFPMRREGITSKYMKYEPSVCYVKFGKKKKIYRDRLLDTKVKNIKQDEKEKGQRALLNFGHTFAHALESANNYSNNIIKVLPKSEGPITEAHFVYPQSLKNTARVQAFRNFLFSKIGDWKS